MSKIDGQITGLRKAAQVYHNLGKYAIEVVLLDAADTICELRGALQVASVDYGQLAAENAKLRGLIADLLPFACIGMEDACPTSGCFLFEECRYSTSPDCDVEERMLERLREAGIDMYGEPL